MTAYALPSRFFLNRDSPERLNFHVESGDFLSYLATRVGFIEEFISSCGSADAPERSLAHELRNDLRYVQAHYKVVPRTGDDIQPVRPSGNVIAE
ncbi:MAG TPA: hypothetical protein VGB97_02850 [Candidatus Paceibacterota bacterium]|jgi:hypothetical protein